MSTSTPATPPTAGPVQCHPAYHTGFYDAQAGDPLHDDAGLIYSAGWLAFWNIRAELEAANGQ